MLVRFQMQRSAESVVDWKFVTSIYLTATVHVAPVSACLAAARLSQLEKKQWSVHAPTKEKKRQHLRRKWEEKKKEIELKVSELQMFVASEYRIHVLLPTGYCISMDTSSDWYDKKNVVPVFLNLAMWSVGYSLPRWDLEIPAEKRSGKRVAEYIIIRSFRSLEDNSELAYSTTGGENIERRSSQ